MTETENVVKITVVPVDNGISVLMVGNRLEITANIGAADIEKMRYILSKYEEILRLLADS